MNSIDQTHIYKKYRGKWVGLEADQRTVIASGKTLRAVLRKAKEEGKEHPIVFKVPQDVVYYVG